MNDGMFIALRAEAQETNSLLRQLLAEQKRTNEMLSQLAAKPTVVNNTAAKLDMGNLGPISKETGESVRATKKGKATRDV